MVVQSRGGPDLTAAASPEISVKPAGGPKANAWQLLWTFSNGRGLSSLEEGRGAVDVDVPGIPKHPPWLAEYSEEGPTSGDGVARARRKW